MAAELIDWSHPCPSIFERRKELAPATLRRIAHGIQRYMLNSAKPFIVPVTHQGDNRVHSIDEPLRTVTSARRGEFALATPTLVEVGYGEREGQAPRCPGLAKPLGTVVGTRKHALVTAFLAKHYGGEPGDGKTCTDLGKPAPTVTARDHSALVTSNLIKLRGTSTSADIEEPLHTVTTKHRFGVVTVDCVDYEIADIGMRMLQPRELYRAQGFPERYVIDRGADGAPVQGSPGAHVRQQRVSALGASTRLRELQRPAIPQGGGMISADLSTRAGSAGVSHAGAGHASARHCMPGRHHVLMQRGGGTRRYRGVPRVWFCAACLALKDGKPA